MFLESESNLKFRLVEETTAPASRFTSPQKTPVRHYDERFHVPFNAVTVTLCTECVHYIVR